MGRLLGAVDIRNETGMGKQETKSGMSDMDMQRVPVWYKCGRHTCQMTPAFTKQKLSEAFGFGCQGSVGCHIGMRDHTDMCVMPSGTFVEQGAAETLWPVFIPSFCLSYVANPGRSIQPPTSEEFLLRERLYFTKGAQNWRPI